MSGIKLKVCGMRDPANMEELGEAGPDFMGLIFYPRSKRYVGDDFDEEAIPKGPMKRVGVFVNEDPEGIVEKVKKYGLNLIQLHGTEPVEHCRLYQQRIPVIKVLSVLDELPHQVIREYEPYVDYFLFDTKTPEYGGSGKKFDWEILREYSSKVPFFLSGGIGPDDIETIRDLDIPHLHAIDVNSGVEVEPGLKDMEKVGELISRLTPSSSLPPKLSGGAAKGRDNVSEVERGHPSESLPVRQAGPLKGRVDTSGSSDFPPEGESPALNSPLEGGKGGVTRRNKIIPYKPYLKEKARELRKHSTTSEVLLWMEIKNRQIKGYQFHRQVPMLDYIVDFYCHELMLAIEIDGDSHEHKAEEDAHRQERLEEYGVCFLRFDDRDVKGNMTFVLEEISQWISEND